MNSPMVAKTKIARKGCCHFGPKCCGPYATKRQTKHSAKRAEKIQWKKEW